MKNILIPLLICGFEIATYTQKASYDTQINIPYYHDSISQTDEYIKERCVLDIYIPKDTIGFATVVWFHGGGLRSGEKEIPEALKEKGVCIIAPNYRLYPNVHSPKYLEDAAAAVAWVFNNISSYGGDSSLILLSGHSAGGYLASMIGLDKRWLDAYGIDANRIAGLIPFSGHTITHLTIREERGIADTQPVIDDLAPLYHVRADAPPLLLITGDRELELLGRYEENAYMMRMMRVVGHTDTRIYELDGYGHGMTEPAFPLLLNEIQRITEKKHIDSQNN
jgi:acetyl esterase/lipase